MPHQGGSSKQLPRNLECLKETNKHLNIITIKNNYVELSHLQEHWHPRRHWERQSRQQSADDAVTSMEIAFLFVSAELAKKKKNKKNVHILFVYLFNNGGLEIFVFESNFVHFAVTLNHQLSLLCLRRHNTTKMKDLDLELKHPILWIGFGIHTPGTS
jgi:hypothetical protein